MVGKVSKLLVLFSLWGQLAFALDSDIRRIEMMLSDPPIIQRLEKQTEVQSSDTSEVRLRREDLKKSIAAYRKVAADIRAKYEGWIANGYKADEVRRKIQAMQDSEYVRLALGQMELCYVNVQGFLLAPKGMKGSVAEAT
jgi:hypothetical protein